MDTDPKRAVADSGGAGITRRSALFRFAALTSGLALGAPVAANAAASATSPLDGPRQRILTSLAEAYAGVTWIGKPEETLPVIAKRYGAAGEEYRVWFRALLDAVDVSPSVGRFSTMSVSSRRRQLESWATATEPSDGLMSVNRASDASEPDSLKASNERASGQIRAKIADLPPGATGLDPVTGLANYAPPVGRRPAITTGGPSSTDVRVLRTVAHYSYEAFSSVYSTGTYGANATTGNAAS